MKIQVDKSHYEFERYVDKKRWASIWHQLNEVLDLNPDRVLEIGPGPGLFKILAGNFNLSVETLDIDPGLQPSCLASVCHMPFKDDSFDVVCAFQMLEHLPFDRSLRAFNEMARVARKGLVISVPDAAVRWPMSIYIPTIGSVNFSIPRPRLRAPRHQFNGEHYWEISKAGYSLKRVKKELLGAASVRLARSYRVEEHPYHHFFIFHCI